MKYERFEDLPVWQLAADLAARMFVWSRQNELRGLGDLPNQIQRATLSISNNIAEGFERGTTNELLNFLYYARGSAGEVRSMLCVLERMLANGAFGIESTGSKFVSRFDEDIRRLKVDCESISKQIRGWANSLQNSDIAGQKHLNDQTRTRFEQKQRQTEALAKHRQFMEQKAIELREAHARSRMRSGQNESGEELGES